MLVKIPSHGSYGDQVREVDKILWNQVGQWNCHIRVLWPSSSLVPAKPTPPILGKPKTWHRKKPGFESCLVWRHEKEESRAELRVSFGFHVGASEIFRMKSPKFGTFWDLDPVSQKRNEDGYFLGGKRTHDVFNGTKNWMLPDMICGWSYVFLSTPRVVMF